ncbi:hypothetical protein SAMN05877753_10897 [Bacillus oleivorans]|uniref:Phosphoesterase n=1 Tax=Bacillus oleivorans TaxID=1448271 RepID=A0A285D2L5_9BACI|nr:metallophosphoesterase family protein [Bacillus oleivorans]SNX74009.1 hypothetical protein SAMN05877753_10897 [Bacillus oleivorans]
MKIIIMSDTHLPKRAKHLPMIVIEAIQNADLIIHAGDWTTIELYEELKELAPIQGVYGNVDSDELIKVLEDHILLDINGHKIGVTHGHLGKAKSTPVRAYDTFANEKTDLIIFGHSHIPYIKKHNDVILFNPGSPTDKRFQPQYSFGILEIKHQLTIKHHFFDHKTS